MSRIALLFFLAALTALAAEGLAGAYKGTWSGSSGASGDFSLTLKSGDDGKWDANVGFSLNGEDVKTKVTSIQVDGAKVKIVYEFDLQDTRLESTITGELKGNALAGTYATKAVADGSAVDTGDWKTTSTQ